jgi:hypothetical protein
MLCVSTLSGGFDHAFAEKQAFCNNGSPSFITVRFIKMGEMFYYKSLISLLPSETLYRSACRTFSAFVTETLGASSSMKICSTTPPCEVKEEEDDRMCELCE